MQVKLNDQLLFAVKDNYLEKVARLIEDGADVNATAKLGVTPLHYACIKGSFEIIKLLIKNGADVNIRSNKQQSSLYYACNEGYFEIAEFLLENGADIHAANNDGAVVELIYERKLVGFMCGKVSK